MEKDHLKWDVLESKYLHNDTWFKARMDTCVRPDGKIVDPYYVMEYPTWVCGVALTEDNKVIMIRQYRHAIGETIIEIPGGCVDATDATLEDAIKREVLEETGYTFTEVHALGKTSSNPSTNSNLLHMFLLKGGTKLQDQELDHNEEIEVMLMSIDEVLALLQQNKILQSMHVATLFYALQKMGTLSLRTTGF